MSDPESLEAIERRLWSSADNLRANSNYASNEYFMPVMGLIFLRHAYSRFLTAKTEIEATLPSRGGEKRPLTKGDFSGRGTMRPGGLGAWAGALFSGLGDWDFRDAARQVTAPALVVQRRQDRITPPAGAEDWTALLPNAELLWVAEAGHVPLQERPEVLWPAVERFLAAGR